MTTDFTKIELSKNTSIPVYVRLYDWIAANIRSGSLKPGDSLPGIYVLAGQSGISPMTIRQTYRKLQDDGLLTMQQGRGTFVTEASRLHWKGGDEVRKSLNIGVLMLDVDIAQNAAFSMSLFSGIGMACRQHSLRSHLFSLSGDNLNADDNFFVRELIRQKLLDGLLIGGPLVTQDIEALQILNIPFVLLDNDARGQKQIPRVLIDDRTATAAMLEELAQKGFSRIALLAGQPGKNSRKVVRRAEKMEEAYREWCVSHRRSEVACRFCAYDEASAKEEMEALLRLPSPPDAVIANGDAVTMGALQAAAGKPTQVFNYADAEWSPGALGVKPWREVGQAAAELLWGLLSGIEPAEQVVTLQARLRRETGRDN